VRQLVETRSLLEVVMMMMMKEKEEKQGGVDAE
jgi:hypothetical protein